MTISDHHAGPDQAFTSADGRGPAEHAGWREEAKPRVGFFTDTSICIGCKACEVACKEWNQIPDDGFTMLGSSYDNTGKLSADSWRHVEFIEQRKPLGAQETGITIGVSQTASDPEVMLASPEATLGFGGVTLPPTIPDKPLVDLGMPAFDLPSASPEAGERTDFRWLMASNVCKHCTNAGCLDVCPTGALFRTEFGTVVVQDDICNGCGYCVAACPFGVIDRRVELKNGDSGTKIKTKNVGIAQKCTLCYDRIGEDQTPACAQACPTQSIQFGTLDELRERAVNRVEALHAAGVPEAQLYAEDPDNGVGGAGAFFLLLDEPEVYGFPPDPIVTTADLPRMWKHAGLAAAGLLLAAITAFSGRRP